MSEQSKKFIIGIILIVLTGGIYWMGFVSGGKKEENESLVDREIKKEVIILPESNISEEKKLPNDEENPPVGGEKININVPFTSQAPFSVWDEKHEEACEEASLVMVKYYLDGKTLNKEISEKEIQDLIEFQIENYGDYKDTDAAATVKLAEDYYEIQNLRLLYDFKKEDLKKELDKGNPIIVPAAGRLLGNPNFTAPGPLYHNLVLTGYAGDSIITNDPGTRKGEGYQYDINVLYDAIHDFPGRKEDIEKGRKAMIVVEN